MLARLLRRLVLFQLALAVLIAMALIHFTRLAPAIAWPLAPAVALDGGDGDHRMHVLGRAAAG